MKSTTSLRCRWRCGHTRKCACTFRHQRVAVEAALRFGWDQYLGEHGGFVGMTGFGASGPADALYEKFGITAGAIAAEARRCLAGR
jgi:transketolase